VVNVTGATCDEAVNWVPPTATDNCSVASFTSSHNSGDTFPAGTTMVTYTAIDPAGIVSTCTFNVTVNDNTAPVISNCPVDIVVNLSGGACDEVINWVVPTATDNCGVASFNSTYNPGDTFPLGTTVVSYIATDLAGNVALPCTFKVIVNKISPPQFDLCPTTVNIGVFDVTDQSAIVTWQEPEASDICGVPTITSTFNSGDKFPPGLTKVVYTATDASGNTAVCEFDVDVVGNKAPTGTAMVIEAFTGELKEICLDVRDPDGDVLIVTEINYNMLNGIIDRSGDAGDLCFIYTSFDAYEGEEFIVATVCDSGTPTACIKVEVRIKVSFDLRLYLYKAFTPDGDNINDLWVIENIKNYPNNQVMIYDRLGGLIFSARGYNNEDIVWDGRSNQNAQNILPSGTYFYKIDLGSEAPTQKGFIELVN
jgi:gliding motility-associated-like protein